MLSVWSSPRLPAQAGRRLVGLGMACNQVAFALTHARLEEQRAVDAVCWVFEREENGEHVPEEWVIGDWHSEERDHAERLAAVYACAVASYTGQAVETLSALIARREVPTEPVHARPSDILTLPDIALPLLQLPTAEPEPERERSRIRLNQHLAASHRKVLQAMSAVLRKVPAAAFDDTHAMENREPLDDFEDDFPVALHSYAAACVSAIELLATSRA